MTSTLKTITIGCDPEFFLKDRGGTPISAHNVVPGTKQDPFPLDGGAVQADGTAVEFNINPARTPKAFARNVKKVLKQIREMVPAELEFSFEPCVYYNKGYFDTLPPLATELGCEPDLSCVTGKEKIIRVSVQREVRRNMVMRTGSGHIHIGWTKDKTLEDKGHVMDCQALANYHFNTVDVLCRKLGARPEQDKRLRLYGSEGAYRVKPYGIELRSLANSWVKHPKLYETVFNLHHNMMTNILAGKADVFRGESERVSYCGSDIPTPVVSNEWLGITNSPEYDKVRDVYYNGGHIDPLVNGGGVVGVEAHALGWGR